MRFRKSGKSAAPDDDDTMAVDSTDDASTDATAALALAEAEAAAAAAARARADEIRLKDQSASTPAEDQSGTDSGDTDDVPATQAGSEDAEPAGETAVDDKSDDPAEDSAEDSEPADTESGDPEPGPSGGGPTGPAGGVARTVRRAAAVVAILAIGALVTVSVLMVVHHRGVQDQERQAAEYAAAARQGVVTLMSLDFNNVDDDVQRIIENSTGDFRKEFEGQAQDFATVAKESKVVTEATATAAGVESMTDTEAVVLVTATSTVTNTSGADQEPRTWRLAVNVTRDGDRIKMSKVEFAP